MRRSLTKLGFVVSGERPRLLRYSIDVPTGGKIRYANEVVGDAIASEIILGCDLLNPLDIVLDGLGEAVQLLP